MSGVRFALLGGVYNNYLALEAALGEVWRRGVDQIFCLGDLGAFGPHPDRVFPLLADYDVACLQGNYDHSIGHGLDDCRCGYTDPRDNHFAQLSYDYTLAHTSREHREFLRELPPEIRVEAEGVRILLCHGSPRRVNEFLWESTTPTHFLRLMFEQQEADVIAATHTGLKWRREVGDGRQFVNVGVLGRPENDGRTNVWCTLLSILPQRGVEIEFVPIEYDFRRLAAEMASERLPQEFVETIVTGYWTTCLEVLPSKERRRGKY